MQLIDLEQRAKNHSDRIKKLEYNINDVVEKFSLKLDAQRELLKNQVEVIINLSELIKIQSQRLDNLELKVNEKK